MNEPIFKENLKQINKDDPQSYEYLSKLDESFQYEIIETKSKDFTFTLRTDNKTILFHSKYNPLEEAKKILKADFKDKPELLVLGGFGMGYLVEAAIEIFPDIPIIVWEKDENIFKLALQTRKLTKIFSNKNIRVRVSEDLESLPDLLTMYKGKNVAVSIHRPSFNLYQDFYQNIKKVVHSFINSKEININTLSKFQKLWTKNILKNMIPYIKSPGIKSIFNKYRNIPCVVVAAGPSLNQHLDLLKKYKDNYIIIACDTVLQILLHKDIKPDIVVAVDPQDINKKYFNNIPFDYTLLVCEPSISPKIIRNFPLNHLMMSSVFPMAKWLEEFSCEKGETDIGGSVATAAYSIAYNLGCDPIIFIGLDLAYSGDETHAKGAYFEQGWFYKSNRFKTFTTYQTNFFSTQDILTIKGYYGDEVKSDRKFLMFLWWFESKFIKANRTIIDATQGGAYIKNCKQLGFKETIKSYCNKPLNINVPVPLAIEGSSQILQEVFENLQESKEILIEIIPLLNKAILLTKEAYHLHYKKIKYNQALTQQFNEMLREMDEIDEIIMKKGDMNRLIGLSMQRIIHIINEDFDFDLSDLEKEHKELRILKRSQMLYTEMKEASEYIIYQIDKTLLRAAYK